MLLQMKTPYELDNTISNYTDLYCRLLMAYLYGVYYARYTMTLNALGDVQVSLLLTRAYVCIVVSFLPVALLKFLDQ